MSTNTDALVPVAWVRPSRAPNWHAPGWHSGAEPPTPLTRPEAIARGWSPLYGPDTIERLTRENAALKTVMVAAAEEIQAHWQAHCDAEGYGPQNLMRRLEEGIPSEYGYTAGAFAELKRERDEAVARESALHDAVCQAVSIMNMAIEIARSENGRKAKDLLRQALVDYADAIATTKATT